MHALFAHRDHSRENTGRCVKIHVVMLCNSSVHNFSVISGDGNTVVMAQIKPSPLSPGQHTICVRILWLMGLIPKYICTCISSTFSQLPSPCSYSPLWSLYGPCYTDASVLASCQLTSWPCNYTNRFDNYVNHKVHGVFDLLASTVWSKQ